MRAVTEDGPSIRARSIVLATGYEFPKVVPMRGHRITTTWAFATRPQRSRLWPEECLVWEAATPYLYLRTTKDGRVICGGEDSSFEGHSAYDGRMDAKIARMRRKLARLFPNLDTEPEHTWAASFGETATGLPTIAPVPRHPRLWVALGYGGNGITYSRLAAEILSAEFCGRRDADADLYAFR